MQKRTLSAAKAKRNATSAAKRRRADYMLAGWGNVLTEVGLGLADKSRFSKIQKRFYDALELEALYTSDSLARRIVNRPVDDAIREGFKWCDLPKMVVKRLEVLENAMRKYRVLGAIAKADKTARLYGGALLIPLTEGDGAVNTPLQPERVTKLVGFEVVAAPDAIAKGAITPRQYVNPEFYSIYGGQDIHASRCIRFDGAELPERMLLENRGWHLSELNAPYASLRRLGVVRAYIEALTHNISLSVLKIAGLGKKLMGGKEARQKAKDAVRELQRQIDSLHWLAIDKEDSFDVSSRPMQGLSELEARCLEAVLADQELPREILTNITPGGLNSGSTGPLEQYYATLHFRQESCYTPALGVILPILFSLLRMKVKTFTIEWLPLWHQSEKEKAETRKTNAEADKIYVEMGAASALQIGAARVADGSLPVLPEVAPPAPDGPSGPSGPEGPDGPDDSSSDPAEGPAAAPEPPGDSEP